VVLLALHFGSYSWTTKEIMDELVRKADCAVVGIRFQSAKNSARENLTGVSAGRYPLK
jgi:hypothetical protein